MSENDVKTLVMVGRIGNGKSSTGNSIIGSQVFKAQARLTGVTCTSVLKSVTMDDGQTINVIDTPGLFDTELRHDFICKEIVKCLDFARGGIHGLLLVISVRSRFSIEELEAVNLMMDIFGAKITDYMTIIVTGVDDLEEGETTPEDFLKASPEPLKKILAMCRQRHAFFNNRTKDEAEKKQQVQNLLNEVNRCMEMNNWEPFTNAMMTDMQKKKQDLPKEGYAEMLEQATLQIEAAMRESIQKLEERLEEEKFARINAEAANKITSGALSDLTRQLEQSRIRERAATERARKPFICSIM